MRTGIATRVGLITSLLVVAATATVGYLVYRGARQALIQASTERLINTAEITHVRFEASVDAVGKDVRFLASTPPVHGIVRALSRFGLDPETAILDSEWRDQLAEIFESFLESRPSYIQARFISARDNGLELVRVERVGNEIRRVEGTEFRQVGKQAYFREATTLKPGQLYLSDFTSDFREYGTAWTGVPIMQAATPIFTETGSLFGLVVVDVDFRHTLRSLKSLVEAPRELYLARGDGKLLLYPENVRSPVGPAPELQQIQGTFPLVEPVLRGKQPELRVQDAVMDRSTPAVVYFRRLPFDRGVGRSDLILGVAEPHPTILAGVRRVRNESALIILFFGLAGIGVALGVSRYLTGPIRRITRAVLTFGGGGHAAELPVQRRDEIGILARSFDSMARQIQAQIRKLEDEERRQRTILETSAEGIIVTDSDGLVEAFNPAAEHILGLQAQEVLGVSAGTLIHPVSDDDAQPEMNTRAKKRAWMRLRRGDEAIGCRKDGSTVPLSISWSTFELAGEKKYTIFLRDITDQKAAAKAQAQLLRELESERTSLQHLSTTLEERVRERTDDLLRINNTLERRNQDLREFVHVASHDLQEPLRKLRAFADILLSEHVDEANSSVRHYVERMCESAERMSQLIADLRSFHSITAHEKPFELVDLNTVAREVLSDLEIYIAESGGTVEVEKLPALEGDRVQMRQLLQNLIMNGTKFHKPGIPPAVRVYATIEEEGGIDASEDEVCRIKVQDNGIGFEEKYLDRIFSPFQRLHAREGYEGTGMGLAICRRIVEHHGGTITARSKPGEGTTFIVTLPVHQQPLGQSVAWNATVERAEPHVST